MQNVNQFFSTDTGHHYRLEPIVQIHPKSCSSEYPPFGFEVLAGKTCCPSFSTGDWLSFYNSVINDIVHMTKLFNTSYFFLNFSGHQLLDSEILSMIYRLHPIAQETGKIVLEWTEHTLNDALWGDLLDTINKLKNDGFLLAIDDIGSGMDGMGRVLACTPHFGKIDGSILRMERSMDSKNQGMYMRGIVDSLRAHNIQTIVEHIESDSDIHIGVRSGAEYGQGYRWKMPSIA